MCAQHFCYLGNPNLIELSTMLRIATSGDHLGYDVLESSGIRVGFCCPHSARQRTAESHQDADILGIEAPGIEVSIMLWMGPNVDAY